MTPDPASGPTGATGIAFAILALLLGLTGLLGFLLAGSMVLMDHVSGMQADPPVVLIAAAAGLGYLLLAWSVARASPWSLPCCAVMLMAMLLAGIAGLERQGTLQLATASTLALAQALNFAALLVLGFERMSRSYDRRSRGLG